MQYVGGGNEELDPLYSMWRLVHKRCLRVRGSLVRVVGFVCKRCCDDLVEVDQKER